MLCSRRLRAGVKQTTYPPNQKADTAQGGDNVKREKRPKTLAERLTWPLFFAVVAGFWIWVGYLVYDRL